MAPHVGRRALLAEATASLAAGAARGGASETTTRTPCAHKRAASAAARVSAPASKRDAMSSVAGMSMARLSCWMAPVSSASSTIVTGTRIVRSSSQREARVQTMTGWSGRSAPNALMTSTCRLACPKPWPEMQNATATVS